MTFAVRKATLCDAEALAQLYLQFWEVHENVDLLIELEERPTLCNQIEAAKKAIRKRTAHIFVAVENNEIIGYIEFLIKKNEDCFKIKEYGYLDACVTHKKHRKKGVAQKLTRAVFEFFKERGIMHVRTTVYNINEPGTKVLHKLGFRSLSTVMMRQVQFQN